MSLNWVTLTFYFYVCVCFCLFLIPPEEDSATQTNSSYRRQWTEWDQETNLRHSESQNTHPVSLTHSVSLTHPVSLTLLHLHHPMDPGTYLFLLSPPLIVASSTCSQCALPHSLSYSRPSLSLTHTQIRWECLWTRNQLLSSLRNIPWTVYTIQRRRKVEPRRCTAVMLSGLLVTQLYPHRGVYTTHTYIHSCVWFSQHSAQI